ncbi:hypothetical protein CHARACLAT_016697 [Characodon lateralis]|uniref:Uncharacterized protein n=2 Tax=Goodeidae TaxID=28758 RepID=A0ABU7A6A0_9TELE|nr:hypothetical protein [Ataeniobius toweri]MED6264627.1 hypothetical protein [Characodon lateralis]
MLSALMAGSSMPDWHSPGSGMGLPLILAPLAGRAHGKSPQPELNKRMSRVPGETWIIRAQVLKWRVNLMRWLFFIWVTC